MLPRRSESRRIPRFRRMVVPLNQTGLLSWKHSKTNVVVLMHRRWPLLTPWSIDGMIFCLSGVIRIMIGWSVTLLGSTCSHCCCESSNQMQFVNANQRYKKKVTAWDLIKRSLLFVFLEEKKNQKTKTPHLFLLKNNSCPPAVETSSASEAMG